MTTNNPVTIDNLGIEASRRYALDQQNLDSNLIKDARMIPSRTELAVIQPYLSTGISEFSIGNFTLWAAFSAPVGYQALMSSLFTHQLIPALGDAMQIQALLDQVSAMASSFVKNPDQQRAFRKISDLLTLLEKLMRMFTFIKANCARYQQG